VTPSVRLPTLVLWLTLLWALLWGDFSAASLLAGLAIAIAVVVIARPTGVRGIQLTTFHPVSALVYLGYFMYQLVKSNLHVAWEIITPGSKIDRAIVAVPMHVSTAGLVTLVGNSVTLTPGTLTVDVRGSDNDRPPTLYIHVLHYKDSATVRASVYRLERLVVKAFGTRQQVAAIDAAVTKVSGDD